MAVGSVISQYQCQPEETYRRNESEMKNKAGEKMKSKMISIKEKKISMAANQRNGEIINESEDNVAISNGGIEAISMASQCQSVANGALANASS
jgi:hypothetical protein